MLRLRAALGVSILAAGSLALTLACRSSTSPESTDPEHAEAESGEAEAGDGAPRDLAAEAEAIARETIILDGHVDAPIQIVIASRGDGPALDIGGHDERVQFDYERARAGGLDAPFMSVYTPASLQGQAGAPFAYAEERIDSVLALIEAHPDKFARAGTPTELRQNFERGLISLPMGMENGAPIEDELANVRHFYDRGIRYVTLTHSKDNHISDSSYADTHTHGGLSDYGREVVVEMNRVGVMVDVSHLSDEAFWDVLEVSAVPVIASHSSCRAFTPGFERNMSDEMILALAEEGGVIQINFGGQFLSNEYREAAEGFEEQLEAELDEHGVAWGSPEAAPIIAEVRERVDLPTIDVGMVADQIEHVIELAGPEHVGFGSDFDGVGPNLPEGLSDVSMYPNLIRALLERGHERATIEKICSANVLRVWQAVEDYAAPRRDSKPSE